MDHKNDDTKDIQSDLSCPICGATPVESDMCPADCGSLEGIDLQQQRQPTCTFAYDWANGYVAPFLGIDEDAARSALMAAGVSNTDKVVDLGCGDGRICRIACELGAMAADGFDLDEELIRKAKELTETMDTHKKPSFHMQDLFQVPLDSYTIITMFLLPETTEKLVPKLRQEALSQPNCRILSFGWPIHSFGAPVSSWTDNKSDSKGLTDLWFLYTPMDKLD